MKTLLAIAWSGLSTTITRSSATAKGTARLSCLDGVAYFDISWEKNQPLLRNWP